MAYLAEVSEVCETPRCTRWALVEVVGRANDRHGKFCRFHGKKKLIERKMHEKKSKDDALPRIAPAVPAREQGPIERNALRIAMRLDKDKGGRTTTHTRLGVWVNGLLAGSLIVRRGVEETTLGVVVDALLALRAAGVPVEELPSDDAGVF